MSRIVLAAATMGTGKEALNKNERALCLMKSTTSDSPRRIPPMPPNVLENVLMTTGTFPSKTVLLDDASAALAQCARAVRVVAHDGDVLVLSTDVDKLLDLGLVAIERIDAFDHHQCVLPIALPQHPIECFGAVVIEETNLGRSHRRPGSQERAIEDAGVTQVVEDDRRVLVG